MIRATNIQWETDGESVELPESMDIPDHVESDSIADYLSEQTGWLVLGFETEESSNAPSGPESGPSGDLRPLVEHLAQCWQAARNCERSGNAEWLEIWQDRLAALAREHLPSGSGFDNGTEFLADESRHDRLIFSTAFHHMAESGMYDGWTEHRVVVIPGFLGFELKVTGRDKRGIKDYIGQTFHDMLSAPVRLSDLAD